ncbi:hypothetical protein ACTGJ9_020865 [Bradyrhizobium sp. RDM12]
MTDSPLPLRLLRKRTPADTTPFERDQLRFLLSDGNLALTLSDINPSLAWLSFLWEAKLVNSDTQLIAWIERNFSDIDAVRDVAANINSFEPETATLLDFRLSAQTLELPPLLQKSWSLILRHMRSARRGLAHNEWFEILPKLRKGDHSVDVLERLSNSLRPRIKVGKRLSWYREEQDRVPERPSDLMSIDYEVRDGVTSKDAIEAWSTTFPATADEELLRHLTSALNAALADATDAGAETNEGYSVSDTDVPSVARHQQNEYRSGFQAIVRVTAEVWSRLASKSKDRALAIAKTWRDSQFRLTRRLALFAFANAAMPGKDAAETILALPSGELFLTASSVEAYRLILERWNDFSLAKRAQVLKRLCEGPPRDWFKSSADVDQYIDRSRYDFLADMVHRKVDIDDKATRVLDDIRARWPEWRPKPSEQIGFHVWHESGFRSRGNNDEALKAVSDDQLVAQAQKLAAVSRFGEDDTWYSLSISEPDRAIRGLAAAAASGAWPKELWQQALWSRTTYVDAATESRMASLLLCSSTGHFENVVDAASSWLADHAKTLSEDQLWPLWDRVANASLTDGDGDSH